MLNVLGYACLINPTTLVSVTVLALQHLVTIKVHTIRIIVLYFLWCTRCDDSYFINIIRKKNMTPWNVFVLWSIFNIIVWQLHVLNSWHISEDIQFRMYSSTEYTIISRVLFIIWLTMLFINISFHIMLSELIVLQVFKTVLNDTSDLGFVQWTFSLGYFLKNERYSFTWCCYEGFRDNKSLYICERW